MADVRISDLSLISAANLDNNDRLIVEQTSNGTGASKLSSIKEKMLGNSTITGLGGSTVTEAIAKLNELANYSTSNNSTLIHNSIGRGQNITKTVNNVKCVSPDQWTEIKNGTFRDMYIGDYWLIGGVTYRIAAFDYYYGRNPTEKHHVVLVPDSLLIETTAMNNAQDNSAGYTGTTLYETLAGTNAARTAIEGAFGSTHIWSHKIFLVSAFSNNSITGQTILFTDIIPMTLGNVFGSTVPSLAANSTLVFGEDSAQFPLFMMYPFRKVVNGKRYWTRDPFGTKHFCGVTMASTVAPALATDSTNYGLRPSFCICDPS